MKRSIKVAGVVTLITLGICYAGIRQELTIAQRAPVQSTNFRLADRSTPPDTD
jgi:hypothetical protein